MNWPEAAEEHARAFVRKLLADAEPYPFFLASEMPAKCAPAEAETWLAELGSVADRMSPLQQADLFVRAHKRIPNVPKGPAKRAFEAAIAKAKVQAERAPASGAEGETKTRAAVESGKLRGHVALRTGYYVRETATGDTERITSYGLELVQRVVKTPGEPDWLHVRVHAIDKAWNAEADTKVLVHSWKIPPKAWESSRSFNAAQPHTDMVWSGSDQDVQGLKELLTSTDPGVPRVTSTSLLGRHVLDDGRTVFVLPWGTLGPDGTAFVDPPLVYLPDGGSDLQHRLPDRPPDAATPLLSVEAVRALTRRAFEAILTLHEPEAVAAVVAWSLAALFAPFLRKELGAFPFLNVYGSPQSGKSSLLQRLCWPLVAGASRPELMSCFSTLFTLTRNLASANALPVVFDEFRTDTVTPKQVADFTRKIRQTYTGETEPRGKADQSMNAYALVALVCILGESRFGEGDQALTERGLFVPLDGNWIRRQPPAAGDAFRALTAEPLWKCAPLLQGWSLGVDALALLGQARALTAATLQRIGYAGIADRMTINLTVVAFGALAFDAAATWLEASTPAVALDRVFLRLLKGSFGEDAAPGADARVATNLDDFLRDAGTLAVAGRLVEGTHFVWVDGQLRLHLRLIEAVRAAWWKEQGRFGATPGASALRRTAQELHESGTSYVLDAGKRTSLEGAGEADGGVVRCLAIDPAKVPASVEIDAFPREKARTWGGARGATGSLDWEAAARRAGAPSRGEPS